MAACFVLWFAASALLALVASRVPSTPTPLIEAPTADPTSVHLSTLLADLPHVQAVDFALLNPSTANLQIVVDEGHNTRAQAAALRDLTLRYHPRLTTFTLNLTDRATLTEWVWRSTSDAWQKTDLTLIPSRTPLPTSAMVTITPRPRTPESTTGFTCDCSKTCSRLTYAEAQFQLNVCGCTRRDADGDGLACEAN
jgi:hypothetical protein